jgi:hypothetical protein
MRCARTFALLVAAVLALAACGGGSSGSRAQQLLQQTFGGAHRVLSGNLSFALVLAPVGSLGGQPVSFSFGGPFQSAGPGKLPASDFTVSFSALGKHASLGIVSAGGRGYVTLQGTGYRLPASAFHRLESRFAGVSTSESPTAAAGTLSRLGIHPERWLSDPAIVGSQLVGGAQTTHIHAGIDVDALLLDLGAFLRRGAAIGGSAAGLPPSIPAATRRRIAAAIEHPTFDVWTGERDRILRRLSIGLTVPTGGRLSALFGRTRAARIELTMQYANLGQPQQIRAPRVLRPFREFASRLQGLVGALRGGLGQTGP